MKRFTTSIAGEPYSPQVPLQPHAAPSRAVEEEVPGLENSTPEIQAFAKPKLDGVELAAATSRISATGTNPLLDQVRKNHHLSRSGDIYVIQEPYWFLFDKGAVVAMHGSLWRYDTHVPVLFASPGVDVQRIHRLVHPVDVAPTIAAILGMSPPGSSQGTVLTEVLQHFASTTPPSAETSDLQ